MIQTAVIFYTYIIIFTIYMRSSLSLVLEYDFQLFANTHFEQWFLQFAPTFFGSLSHLKGQ
jgi:hypothetical protein